MDIRTTDGGVVKISTDQELCKTLGVEMVQNMYKVNVDDINQLLAYHEVFGKLQGEINVSAANVVQQNAPSVVSNVQSASSLAVVAAQPKAAEANQEASTSGSVNPADSPPAILGGPGHACDLCGKLFQYRYQLIVHRRYHTERKPFTCQVRWKRWGFHS